MKNDDISKGRRGFLLAGLSIAATGAVASVVSNVEKDLTTNNKSSNNLNDNVKKSLQSTQGWNDGLAHPIPYNPKLGVGKEKGLALGGGGIYLLSFYCGYFHGLKKAGVDLSKADIVVGTSAGSIAGAMLTGGFLWKIRAKLSTISFLPSLFSLILPATTPNASQIRAKQSALQYNNADAASLQAIGKAAMASRNDKLDSDNYYKSVHKLIGTDDWKSEALHITANDCYTGERVVISKKDNVAIYEACAASSSLPGNTGPTWVKNRLCMDGGICETSTHCDVISGVKKALVISLGDGTRNEVTQGLRISALPDTLNQEIQKLKQDGTDVFHVVAGLLPGINKIDSVMDPKWIKPMLEYGYKRAELDAAKMKKFWA